MNKIINKLYKKLDEFIISGKLFYIVLTILLFFTFLLFLETSSIKNESNFFSLEGKNTQYIPLRFFKSKKVIYNNKNFPKQQEETQKNIEKIGSEGKLKESYISKVLSKIEKNKRYPKIELFMEREGSVKVFLELDSKGNIKKLDIIEGTNENFINEAIRCIKVSAPFDPLPEEYSQNFEFILTIKFILK